jgi:hypothetical protein
MKIRLESRREHLVSPVTSQIQESLRVLKRRLHPSQANSIDRCVGKSKLSIVFLKQRASERSTLKHAKLGCFGYGVHPRLVNSQPDSFQMMKRTVRGFLLHQLFENWADVLGGTGGTVDSRCRLGSLVFLSRLQPQPRL